jgi:hypothetical protein
MKIKDLKAKIADMPDDMEVVVGHVRSESIKSVYNIFGYETRKAKIKRIKEVDGYIMIQSRPVKDDDSRLALIIE